MSLVTNWGYSFVSATSLTDFITITEFNNFTNSKFAGDVRIAPNITSATRSIQNYCGWHIYPNLECEILYRVFDLRDYFVGSDLVIQLPARFVTSISSILLNPSYDEDEEEWTGTEVTDYDLDSTGILRIYDLSGNCGRKTKIRISYYAGCSAEQIDVIKELTAHRVVHAVSSSYGIMSEAAGGVSVTYNSSWAGNTRSTALPDDNKEILETYKVKGVY